MKAKAIDLEELAKEIAKQLGEVDDTWWLALVEVLTPAGEIAIGLSLVIDIADKLNSKMGVGNFAAVEMPKESKEIMASILQARKYDPDPYARLGQKKQEREKKSKSREKDNFESRSNKRSPNEPKRHTPGKDHQKYSQER